ncbi:TPA: hypothetical protein N3G98_004553 [Salmonella enterica subsp. enterica serovar Denver]|nr:hypothetical protein [Salmonella enterica subsp. enterica serovar Denver]ECD5429476.1 hypothetical protein [Salmonella enterica subsp. enterica serovar Denver]HCM3794364.1 hypothetical protein [Salmonella enterica subsp. enterica serovar Denver]
MDALLRYSINRIIELETMLLPAIPETVWPAEVELIFSQTEHATNLPAHHQHRLRHHIHRMWLEKLPVVSITAAASLLVLSMEKYT